MSRTFKDTYRRFSPGWCFGVGVFHFAATFGIIGLHFLAGMSSFTRDASSEIAFWRGLQWLWTPLAMAAWDPHKSADAGFLGSLAFLWSCLIGISAGFLVPLFRGWLHKPLYPTTTPNDNNRKG